MGYNIKITHGGFIVVKKINKKLDSLENISISVTNWIGTPYSIIFHSILFVGIFLLHVFGITFDKILLILTTAVSLEAIYLAIFIQMTVNRHGQSLELVEDDIEDIQENVEELSEDVEEISEDIDEIQAEDNEEDTDDQQIKHTLLNIEKELKKVQTELNGLKKNGLI